MATLINFIEKLRDKYNDPWVLKTFYWVLVDVDQFFDNLWWNKLRIPEKLGIDYEDFLGIPPDERHFL